MFETGMSRQENLKSEYSMSEYAGSGTPRPEYPRPQLVRPDWINLNGVWNFEVDNSKSGKERRLFEKRELSSSIIVPFCPESSLSGIGNKDFMAAVWYCREFDIPSAWLSEKVLVHFEAVDYASEVWVNGIPAGTHKGGYTPFTFDITSHLRPGKNIITLYAEDDLRSRRQPSGKQSLMYHSAGCYYTRTTGIWQTVWLEKVPQQYIKSFKLIPDPDNLCLHSEILLNGFCKGYKLNTIAYYSGRVAGEIQTTVNGHVVNQTISLSEAHLWEPGKPELYDLTFTLVRDETPVDVVNSYFGLRSVSWDNKAVYINNKPVFQRLVLDQGYYPEGIYTASSEEDLKKDILLSMQLGFNGARLHQKVFEPRFLYWADKLGYIVWGEYGSWGLDITVPAALESFMPEWLEAVDRDFNHPAIIGWCPFNETWDESGTKSRQDDNILSLTYLAAKTADKTRPIIDTSGNYHVVTDIFDIHDYEQDTAGFAKKFEPMKNGGEVYNNFPDRQQYGGQPYFVSEYGGIYWNPGVIRNDQSWGYGNGPETEAAFYNRYEGLTSVLLENPAVCGFCYTQLYDVEQERNGLYTYEREAKFNTETIREINIRKAAIE